MGNDNNQIYTEVAENIARLAGRMLLDGFDKERTIDYKGRIDLVTEMDCASEDMIVGRLKTEFPEHGIVAEEGSNVLTKSEYTWIIDPLDGTTNYAHGFGFFAVSIALMHSVKGLLAGVVYAPYLDEMYTATANCGAFLNTKNISVSKTSDIEKSVVATGFPYDIRESNANIREFEKFLFAAQAVRRPGSAAIDLCCVAAGKFDGFWEMQLQPWDTAAGTLIVREAGGVVTDFAGGEYFPFNKKILASNGKIHEKMKEIINE